MTTLKRILIERQAAGTWSVSRERALDGESASGLRNLTEVIGYMLSHEEQMDRYAILNTLMQREIEAFQRETQEK